MKYPAPRPWPSALALSAITVGVIGALYAGYAVLVVLGLAPFDPKW